MSLNRILYLRNFAKFYQNLYILILYIQIWHSTSVNVRLSYHFRASLLWMLSSLFTFSGFKQWLMICEIGKINFLDKFCNSSLICLTIRTKAFKTRIYLKKIKYEEKYLVVTTWKNIKFTHAFSLTTRCFS